MSEQQQIEAIRIIRQCGVMLKYYGNYSLPIWCEKFIEECYASPASEVKE